MNYYDLENTLVVINGEVSIILQNLIKIEGEMNK